MELYDALRGLGEAQHRCDLALWVAVRGVGSEAGVVGALEAVQALRAAVAR